MTNLHIKQRMESLVEVLNDGLHERKEIAAIILLAALAEQNTFLLGPPGTAKSLLARRLATVFADCSQPFEYLMQRFSTPEDLFGPISIQKLKQDEYIRKTDGFLPTAEIAFLDEIWKAGPAILNTLLTLINEKKFRNGVETVDVPLKALIAASNETPPENQGLGALYDRFLVRLYVPQIKDIKHFTKFMHQLPVDDRAKSSKHAIKTAEWKQWHTEMRKVKLSEETIKAILLVRKGLEERNKKHEKEAESQVYVSDRRWKKAMELLRAHAFLCGRLRTNLVDVLLLSHCLWDTNKNRADVVGIVEKAVRDCGFTTELNSDEVITKKDKLEAEIKKYLFYTANVYDTETLEKEEFFRFQIQTNVDNYEQESVEIYIPKKEMKTSVDFHPVNKSNEKVEHLVCNAHKQCNFTIEAKHHNHRYGHRTDIKKPRDNDWKEKITLIPKVSHKKGTRKDVPPGSLVAWKKEVTNISEALDSVIKEIEEQKAQFAQEINTPFVADSTCEIALQGIDRQLQEIRQQREDCKRLFDMLRDPSETA